MKSKDLTTRYLELRTMLNKNTVLSYWVNGANAWSWGHYDNFTAAQAIQAILDHLGLKLEKVYPNPPEVSAKVVPASHPAPEA